MCEIVAHKRTFNYNEKKLYLLDNFGGVMISKPNFTQNERGHSMVEILGVLAIIGVLSIGGIQGYRYAMEKHRANDIVNEVNLRTRDTWNMYQTKDLPDEEEITEWADMTQTGFPIGVYPRSEILFDVEVENVPNGVCKKVLNMDIQGPLFIWVPNGEERLIYNGNNPEICGEGTGGTHCCRTS